MQARPTVTEKFLKENSFILLHFAIFSLGLLKFTQYLSALMYGRVDTDAMLSGINEWAENFPHEQLSALLHYGFSLVALFVFYKLCLFVIYHGKQPRMVGLFLSKKNYLSGYFAAVLGLNLLLLLSHKHIPILLCCWLLLFLYVPIFYLRGIVFSIKLPTAFYLILTTLVVLQFFFIFKPFMFNPMLIENDYIDLSEKTLLSSGEVVNNSQYINDHKIGGLLIYDPRKDLGQTPTPRADTYIKVPADQLLNHFIARHNVMYRYTYYDNSNLLALNSEMTEEDKKELKEIYNEVNSKKNITLLYYLSLDQAKFYKKRVYSSQENDFLEKNSIELNNQVKAGWQLYHHNYILGPINAISLGASPQKQTLLYGWFNTISLMKVMQVMGGINYQTYFKLFYSFYPLYYVLFVMAALLIFRKVEYGLIGALLLSTSIFIIGDQLIRIAPGFNPIRHLFDMTAFLFLYFYLKKSKQAYLVCSLMMGLLSILWSKDFGLFLLAAIIGATMIQVVAENNKAYLKLTFVGVSGIAGLILYFLPIYGINPAFKYLLVGLGRPGTPSSVIIYSSIFVSLAYLGYLSLSRMKDPMMFLSLALFFYCQLLLIYFIWYPSFHHLLDIASPFVFLMMTWIYLGMKAMGISEDGIRRGFSAAILFILIFIYLPSLAYFYHGRTQYEKIFKTHVVYNWSLNKAGFQSTMDPDLFIQSIALINKYDKHNNIYLFSKYDTVLPILANKYSAFPFTDLPLNLFTTKEINAVVDTIRRDNPEYIFVDTDIMRNFNGEIFNRNDLLSKHGNYEESLGRVSVITNLRNAYDKISNLYRPIEKGYLITVYQRIHTA